MQLLKLNLDVTSSKDCAKLSPFLKSNQNNVQNESEEQKKHNGGEGNDLRCARER